MMCVARVGEERIERGPSHVVSKEKTEKILTILLYLYTRISALTVRLPCRTRKVNNSGQLNSLRSQARRQQREKMCFAFEKTWNFGKNSCGLGAQTQTWRPEGQVPATQHISED